MHRIDNVDGSEVAEEAIEASVQQYPLECVCHSSSNAYIHVFFLFFLFTDDSSTSGQSSSTVTASGATAAAPPQTLSLIPARLKPLEKTEDSGSLPVPAEIISTSTDLGESSGALVVITIIPDEKGRFGFNVKGGADQKMPIIVSRVGVNTPADK